jgi:hypothetical protein
MSSTVPTLLTARKLIMNCMSMNAWNVVKIIMKAKEETAE